MGPARRIAIAIVIVAAGLAAPAVASGAATGSLTVVSSSGAVGGAIRAKGTACVGGDEWTYRYPVLRLITGSGSGAVVASIERTGDATGTNLEIPGWVDPDEPAFVAGFCMQDHQGPVDGVWTVTTSTVFTYDEVPVDILPAPGPDPVPFVSYALDRSTAAAGQVITATGTGCPPNGLAALTLVDQADMSGRSGITYLTGEESGIYRRADATGAFTVRLALNAYLGTTEPSTARPVPVGDHWLAISCAVEAGPGVDAARYSGRPSPVHVSSTNPTDSHRITYEGSSTVRVSGSGCTGGRQVTLALDGYIDGPGLIRGDETVVVPAADGSWRYDIEGDGSTVQLESIATCGDPTGSGFRYVRRFIDNTGDHTAIVAVSPDRVEAGDTFTATITGSCHEPVVVQVVDGDEVLAESDPVRIFDGDPGGTVEVVAPDRNGTFTVVAPCNWSKLATKEVEVYGASAPAVPGDAAPATPIPGTAGYTG